MNRISISQAAVQFGVSRRTLERWIRDGRLTSVPSAKDGRKRLVDPETVQFLSRKMPKRRTKLRANEVSNDSAELRFGQAIDKALLQMYRQHLLLVSHLISDDVPELSLEELRDGPFGRDLRRLSAYALGQVHDDARLVRAAVDSVLQALFWPAAAEDYTVPRAFWDTDLGRLLSRAKLRAHTPNELVSIESAARMLGVTAPTIYRWMDDRTLGWARDDGNGRTWVVRRDIDQLKRKASELALRPVTPEHALAS